MYYVCDSAIRGDPAAGPDRRAGPPCRKRGEAMHRILIVDDERSVLNSLQRVLVREGYEVTVFPEGQAALEAAAKEPYDLVLADYRMPGMDGVTFLKFMKERQSDCMRVILTANADLDAVIEAINACEVYRFLSKPWNDHELTLTIRQALAHRDLLLENRRLAEEVRRQQQTLDRLEKLYPGIGHVRRAQDGSVLIEDDDL